MWDNLIFQAPLFRLLIPLFILLYFLKSPSQARYYYPHLALYPSTDKPSTLLVRLLQAIMIGSAIFALADLVIYTPQKSIKKNALDIMIALDSSGSMSLYGFDNKVYEKTRLDVVKEVVTHFIQTRKDDRIGLVAFGTHSSIISPLSFDKAPQIQLVQGLKIGALGKSTALIDAIVLATKVLKKSPSKSKILILLSDGEDDASQTPLPIALKLAKKHHIKIYTIIIDKSDSNMMQIIAQANHTKAYNPKDKKALQKVYKEIDTLEKSPLTYSTIPLAKHLYQYFLALSILTAILLLLLAKKREIF